MCLSSYFWTVSGQMPRRIAVQIASRARLSKIVRKIALFSFLPTKTESILSYFVAENVNKPSIIAISPSVSLDLKRDILLY